MSIVIQVSLCIGCYTVFVYSQTDQSLMTLDQKCITWRRCLGQCNNSSFTDFQCNENYSTSCVCSNLRCSRLASVCVHHCGTDHTLSKHCVECLTRNHSGDCDLTCSDSSACVVNQCDDTACSNCLIGHFGDSCDKKCSTKCPGACNRDNGFCYRCSSGKFGPGCELDCPLHCHRNICFPDTGHCKSCEPGFVGTTCNQTCQEGYYGRKCAKRCSQNCKSGHCYPSSGRCVDGCNTGFFSVYCDKMCPSGTYGEGCLAHCPLTCDTDADTPPCDHVTGACLRGCNPGFQGEHCEVACTQGKFGKNCDTNCSDLCFLKVCNSFSGHCLRCVSGREGPFCEDLVIQLSKRDKLLGSDVTTDQVILIFIMLFAVGGCLWFVLAASMYHRRKLMWEKLWKTGKLPGHYRLPRVWKQKMERASMSSVNKLYGLRRSLGSPNLRRPHRRRLRRRLLSSSESSDNSESSGDTLTTVGDIKEEVAGDPASEKVLEVEGQGGGDMIPKVVTGIDAVIESNDKMVVVQNVVDGERMDTAQWLRMEAESPIKTMAIRLSPDPADGPAERHALYRSGTESSAIGLCGSNTVQMGTTSASDSWARRPLRLLKATTRTRAASRREVMSSSARFSITTEETRTTTSTLVKTDQVDEEDPATDSTTEDTTTQSESTTMVSTEMESETTSVETKTEAASEESHSTSSTSSTTTEITGPSTVETKITEKRPKITFPVKRLIESPGRRDFTQPRQPPRFPPKYPLPPRHTGLLRKGYDILSKTIPIRIKGPTPRVEVPAKPYSPERRHMSSRFLLTRLDDWRRVRQKQLDVTEGVVEVNDERTAEHKSSTPASSYLTMAKTSTTATSSSTWRPSSTEETGGSTATGASSSSTKGTTRTTSAATATSSGQSSRRRRAQMSASLKTSSLDKNRSERTEVQVTSANRTRSRSSTIHSSGLTSLTSTNTLTSETTRSSASGSTSSATRLITELQRSEDITASRVLKQLRPSKTLRGDFRNNQWPQGKDVRGFPSLTEELEAISPQFPKTTLQDLHDDAMKKLARFGGSRGDGRNSSRKPGKEKRGRADVTSNQSARKPVEGFWVNTSPSLGVLSSTRDISQTIGNQSSLAPSFSTGTTTETGS